MDKRANTPIMVWVQRWLPGFTAGEAFFWAGYLGGIAFLVWVLLAAMI